MNKLEPGRTKHHADCEIKENKCEHHYSLMDICLYKKNCMFFRKYRIQCVADCKEAENESAE